MSDDIDWSAPTEPILLFDAQLLVMAQQCCRVWWTFSDHLALAHDTADDLQTHEICYGVAPFIAIVFCPMDPEQLNN